jgi:hypothetical protein
MIQSMDEFKSCSRISDGIITWQIDNIAVHYRLVRWEHPKTLVIINICVLNATTQIIN